MDGAVILARIRACLQGPGVRVPHLRAAHPSKRASAPNGGGQAGREICLVNLMML